MTNFLTAEFNKLLKRKNFYISLAIVTLASLANMIILLIARPDYNSMTNAELQPIMLRFIANKFVAIIFVFITTVFVADTNSNTIKNAITIGYSRSQVYFAKIIVGLVVVSILVLSSMIATCCFCGIWLYNVFDLVAFFQAIVRFALLLLVYWALYIISLTLCYIINNNMLFAIIYFILLLVFTEIIEATAANSATSAFFANMTITHQLKEIIRCERFNVIWKYIVPSSILYIILSISLGLVFITKKDIK